MPKKTIKTKEKFDIELTDEFQEVFDTLENTDQNIFLTGKAGTGKSTFLEYFRRHTTKNVVVVAPTGVAAINVSGQTIHSFFKFKPGFIDPKQTHNVRPHQRKLYRKIDVLIIDEISMVRADLFDAIESFLRRNGKTPGTPFGGCQVCVIGDMYQLPPIVTREDAEIYYRFYDTPYFFSSKTYQKEKASFHNTELTKIFRQSESKFIDILNKVREDNLDSETLAWFNEQRHTENIEEGSNPIILTPTNRLADSTNEAKLNHIDQPIFKYTGVAKGSFEKAKIKIPAPLDLTLKVGAQVMFLRNAKDKRWVNGTIGIVSKLTDNSITVALRDMEVSVDTDTWESIRYEYDEEKEKIVEVVTGSYVQYPLQLAWAVTIHKSQGQTFDNVVIDLGYGAFAAGQTYVALSRCRNLNGIYLKTPMRLTDIQVDEKIVRFSKSLIQNKITVVV